MEKENGTTETIKNNRSADKNLLNRISFENGKEKGEIAKEEDLTQNQRHQQKSKLSVMLLN